MEDILKPNNTFLALNNWPIWSISKQTNHLYDCSTNEAVRICKVKKREIIAPGIHCWMRFKGQVTKSGCRGTWPGKADHIFRQRLYLWISLCYSSLSCELTMHPPTNLSGLSCEGRRGAAWTIFIRHWGGSKWRHLLKVGPDVRINQAHYFNIDSRHFPIIM